jgi:hypothetical protein
MMNKRRLYFFGIFGGFHLSLFILTIAMDASPSFLLDLVGYIPLFKYLAFLGVVMVTADFIWHWLETRAAKKKEDESRLENNTLKAKVYDMQEGKTKVEMPAAKPTPQ